MEYDMGRLRKYTAHNVLKELFERYEFDKGQDYFRFEGVVDIIISSKKKEQATGIIASVFIIPEKTWYRPKNERELADIAINHIEHYKRQTMPQKPLKQSTKPFAGKKLEDKDKMPFGKHKDEKMGNVPPDYLIWIFENNKCTPAVAFYVSENMDTLRKQIANAKKGIR